MRSWLAFIFKALILHFSLPFLPAWTLPESSPQTVMSPAAEISEPSWQSPIMTKFPSKEMYCPVQIVCLRYFVGNASSSKSYWVYSFSSATGVSVRDLNFSSFNPVPAKRLSSFLSAFFCQSHQYSRYILPGCFSNLPVNLITSLFFCYNVRR